MDTIHIMATTGITASTALTPAKCREIFFNGLAAETMRHQNDPAAYQNGDPADFVRAAILEGLTTLVQARLPRRPVQVLDDIVK